MCPVILYKKYYDIVLSLYVCLYVCGSRFTVCKIQEEEILLYVLLLNQRQALCVHIHKFSVGMNHVIQ